MLSQKMSYCVMGLTSSWTANTFKKCIKFCDLHFSFSDIRFSSSYDLSRFGYILQRWYFKIFIFLFFYELKDGMSRLITLASSLRIRLYFIGSVSRDRSNFFFFSRFSVSLLCAVLWAFYSKLLFTVKGAKNVQGRNGMMTRWQFRNWVRILWLMQYFVLLGGEKS